MNDPRITFFPKRKVRALLSGWVPKMNSQDEKRVRLDLMIPLIDEARSGVIPAWIINPLNAMESPESAETEIKLSVSCEGVTVEFWDTPGSVSRSEFLTATTLNDFAIKRITRDKQTIPALVFNTNVKRSWSLQRWCDKYEDCYVWVEFTPTDPAQASPPVPGAQMTISDASNPEAKEEVEQTPEEAEANARAFLQSPEAKAAVDALPVDTPTVKRPEGFDPTDKPKAKKKATVN